MNILFFSHYFYPEGNAPASRVHAFTKRWVKHGHRVTVVTCAPNVPGGVVYEGYRNWLYQVEIIDGVKVVRVWTLLAANKGVKRRILNYLSYLFSAVFFGLFQKADVVISTSPQFFCGWAGVLVSKLRFKPHVLEIRDIWPESIRAVGGTVPPTIMKVLEWLELKMYGAANHIVTVGEGYKNNLVLKGVPDSKISIIMNGLDSDIFIPAEKPVRLAEQWNVQGKFVCSYIGTIGLACGLQVVVEAAEKLKAVSRNDIVFLLVGDGAMQAQLKVRVSELQLDNVVLTGRQWKSQMPSYLALSDVCLVHLRNTALFKSVMPSKIFEAAGMKRPLIMGVEGPAREIVRMAGNSIMMEPENADDLVAAVCYLADNPDLVEKMGVSGYNYIRKNYDRRILAEEYRMVLQSIVGDPKKETLRTEF